MAGAFRAPRWWNWWTSARWRQYSLGSAWALVLLRAPLGPWFAPLALVRSAFSACQLAWNVALGREQPLERHERSDWALLALTLLLAQAYALVAEFGGGLEMTAVGAAMLVPYSFLQMRMVERSRRRHWVTRAERLVASSQPAAVAVRVVWRPERPAARLVASVAGVAKRAA